MELNQTFTTEVGMSVPEIVAEVCETFDIPVEGPSTDKIQNSAKTAEFGGGRNAYSGNTSFLPPHEEGADYKGAGMVEFSDTPVRAVVKGVIWAYWGTSNAEGLGVEFEGGLTENSDSYTDVTDYPVRPEYIRGTARAMTEKFAYKVGEVEDAVEAALIYYTDCEPREVSKSLRDREKAGEDVILTLNGERVTFQVKTGGNRNAKDADYLVVVDDSMVNRQISFEVRRP